MKKLTYILITIIFITLTTIFLISSLGENWIINGNKVYINDEKVYISAEPHTFIFDDKVEFTIQSKVYTGDVDVVFGFDTEQVKPKGIELWNGTHWNKINKLFTGLDYDFQGANKWYYAKDLPIIQNQTYKVRILLNNKQFGFGKYWFAIKPSSETIQEAISNNHLYALDPWYNSFQDWNDDFEDDYINSTFWDNQTESCTQGGIINYNVLNETTTYLDGQVLSMQKFTNGAGDTSQLITQLLAKHDFNDSRNYNITLTINTSNFNKQVHISGIRAREVRFVVINTTTMPGFDASCGVNTIAVHYETIYSFPVLNTQPQDYRIEINGNNFSIWNASSDTLLNDTTTLQNIWYVGLVAFDGGGNDQSYIVEYNLYNWTVKSSDIIDVTLVSPADNTKTNQSQIFNCTADTSSTADLKNVTLQVWNSTNHIVNTSTESVTGDYNDTYPTITFSAEDTYLWNCLWYNINDFSNYAGSNKTLIVNNTIKPNITIDYITTTQGSQTFTFNATITDDFPGLSTCFYSIINSTGEIDPSTTENTTFTCNTQKSETASDYGNYTLRIWANDTSQNNNLNVSEDSFTLSPSPIAGSGGGGGAGKNVLQAKNFSITTRNGQKKLDFSLAKDSVKERKKSFIITNKGTKEITVTVSCDTTDVNQSTKDIEICDYVTFENDTFLVSPNELNPSVGIIKILTPKNASYGDEYFFNIIAESEDGNAIRVDKLSISARVTLLSTIYKWNYFPLQEDKIEADRLKYPISLMAFVFGIILFGISLFVFTRIELLPIGLFFSVLIFFVTFFISTSLL